MHGIGDVFDSVGELVQIGLHPLCGGVTAGDVAPGILRTKIVNARWSCIESAARIYINSHIGIAQILQPQRSQAVRRSDNLRFVNT